MNENTKITLSAKELELVCNTEWILTKHIIIEKVYQLFGSVAGAMQQQLTESNIFLSAITSPKISKGENYRQLPYVMLDYPRLFGKEDMSAVRTFFWWGNFCSVNLLMAGSYKTASQEKVIEHYNLLAGNNYFICTAATPWEHHFEEGNFTPLNLVSQIEFASIVKGHSFLKIAKKIPLSEWDNMQSFILKSFTELAQLL